VHREKPLKDPFAGVEPVSLDELVHEGKPLYVAALRLNGEIDPEGGLLIPETYKDLAEAFSPSKTQELPPHREGVDLAIDLEPGAEFRPHPLYRLSHKEIETLREYINECLAHGFIRPSKSAVGVPILFAPKKDGSLRKCTDYRELNAILMARCSGQGMEFFLPPQALNCGEQLAR
jgi:hypothetical protein